MTLKEKLLKKSNLWHLAAIGVFLLIACVYFYPALDGYVVKQTDVKNWVGASQEIADYRENGEQIGWTSAMFGGMPATQISMVYEGKDIPDFFRGALSLWLPAPISLLFVYFLSFYILAIAFRAKPLVAIVGALAYGLSSYFIIIIEAGHVTKALAVGYAPLLIAGFIFAYRWKNWMLGIALSALFMTFQLSANHLQITYYLIFVLVGLGTVEFFRHLKMENGMVRFLKVTGGLLGAYFIALMVNYGNIRGTQEYTDATTRGGTELTIQADGTRNDSIKTSGLDREYITAWSYGRGETFTFIVPDFKGGETGRIGDNKDNDKALKNANTMFRNDIKGINQYWGDQPFTSGPVYIGVVVVLLAMLALYYLKDNVKWALLTVTLLTVMLSWGRNYVSVAVILPVLLYALAPIFDEKKRRYFLLGNTFFLFFMYAFGQNILAPSLTDFFLDYLPGYNKFRAVTIILVIAELCIPLLGVFFLQKLISAREEIANNLKPFLLISGGFVLVLVGLLAVPDMFTSFLSSGEQDMLASVDPAQAGMYEDFFAEVQKVRISIFRVDAGRSLVILLLAIGAVYMGIRAKDAFQSKLLIGSLGVLILVDLLLVDTRYLSTAETGKKFDQWVEAYKQKYPYTAGDGERQILAFEMEENPALAQKLDSAMSTLASDKRFEGMEVAEKQRVVDWVTFRTLNRYTNFRVLEEGNPFNSSYTSYFNKSIGGYHGAKLGRYQELIEFHLSRNNPAVLDMLNAKYTIRPSYDAKGEIINSLITGVNSTALGNAWLSKEVKLVANADEEISSLNSSKTYSMEVFGNHEVMINGKVDSGAVSVVPSDQVQFIYNAGLDSLGNARRDTVPVDVPYQAVSADMPLVFVLTEQGVTWDYVVNIDSTKIPLLGVKAGGRAGWDPEKVTVMDQRYKSNISQEKYSGEGTVDMVSYHPDLISYSFSSAEKQLVVFSEIYYPVGWKAYVDNEEVPISCVNYVLRAIEVPAGDHKIELVYKVESYEKSASLAWTGSILILVLLAFGIYKEIKLTDSPAEETPLV